MRVRRINLLYEYFRFHVLEVSAVCRFLPVSISIPISILILVIVSWSRSGKVWVGEFAQIDSMLVAFVPFHAVFLRERQRVVDVDDAVAVNVDISAALIFNTGIIISSKISISKNWKRYDHFEVRSKSPCHGGAVVNRHFPRSSSSTAPCTSTSTSPRTSTYNIQCFTATVTVSREKRASGELVFAICNDSSLRATGYRTGTLCGGVVGARDTPEKLGGGQYSILDGLNCLFNPKRAGQTRSSAQNSESGTHLKKLCKVRNTQKSVGRHKIPPIPIKAATAETVYHSSIRSLGTTTIGRNRSKSRVKGLD